MSTITIDVPKWTEMEYKTFFYEIINNYSPVELKEILSNDLSDKSKQRLENIDKLNFVNY